MRAMHKLSLIIPVYNEAKTLPIIWEALQKVAWPIPVEYILIDDGSIDESRRIMESLKSENARILFQGKNQGKTAAILRAMEHSTGTIIVVQDADLEYDPGDIVAVIRPIIEEQADVVFGSRFKQSGSQVHRTWHRLANRLLTFVSNLCSDIYLTDLEGCYKAFRADLIKNVIVTSGGFGFDPEVTAKIAKLRVRIHEVYISYFPRRYIEGKKITWKDGVAALWYIVRHNLFTPPESCFKPTLPERYLR